MVEGTSMDRAAVIPSLAVLALAILAPLPLEAQDLPLPTQEPADTVQVPEPQDTDQVREPEDPAQVEEPEDAVPAGPPKPEIYVADLSVFDDLLYLGPLQKIAEGTNSQDNQPMFMPDSRSLLYTAEYGYGEQIQTEIHRYYFSSRRETRLTRTGESEYSPGPVPGDRAFSATRVETDSARRVWRFTMEGMDGEVLFRDLGEVSHHVWGNESTVLLYVAGDPPTARIGDLTTGESEVVARDVGRSMNKIPNRNAWSFVERVSPVQAWINEINIGTRETRRIISTFGGGEFHAWTPEGVLLMAMSSQIYQWDPEVDVDWRLVADLEDTVLTVTGLAVSPDGSKIAIVGDPIPDVDPEG
jgi:hypothetical protein